MTSSPGMPEVAATSDPEVPRWQWAALAGVAAWVVWRAIWIISRPGILGTDPYTRMWNRDDWVVSIFGRRWLPFVQAFIKAIYDAGGMADEVQAFMAVCSTLLIAAAGWYLWRTAGAVPALMFALLLSVNFNVMWVSASPYQEAPFYLFVFLTLIRLHALSGRTEGSPWPPVLATLPWVVLAMTCRYEGIVLAGAACVAIAWTWWRDRQIRSLRTYAALALLLVLLPGAGLLMYSGMQDDYHSSLSSGLDLGLLGRACLSLVRYLGQSPISTWLAFAVVALFTRRQTLLQGPVDRIAALIYLVGFTVVFLFVHPFYPVTNSRFHVPFVLAILGGGAVGAAFVFRTLASQMQRGRVILVALCVVFLLSVMDSWERTQASMEKRYANKKSKATIGQVLDARVAPPEEILFAWPRGDHHGFPDHQNMQIGAYLRGSTSRIRFVEDFEGLTESERIEWLRGRAGGLLVDRRLTPELAQSLLESVLQARGDSLLRTDLPRGTRFYRFRGDDAGGKSIDRPESHVHARDLLSGF
ncbi:glycosyltransferase family 39 protein [Myxococcota bacterium]|nr:glycosyltransferase family 39 protein [Myxococcota bacterium]